MAQHVLEVGSVGWIVSRTMFRLCKTIGMPIVLLTQNFELQG